METTVLRSPTPADPDAIDVAPDLACLRSVLVNVYLYGEVGAPDREWVLIDAGIPGSAGRIARAAEERFGPGKRPACIVLTHGHFDHVGALRELTERWDCPVYAHPLEMPYLTGRSSYPPPDPTVGGGAMALLSPLYPRGPIDLTGRTRFLPADGSVPGMPGWRWLHTPGHCPGHVSLFRESDRLLVAGDAVVTTRQESLLAVLAQKVEINGPPAYYTQDWDAAHRSLELLAALRPLTLATGHGRPLRGQGVADDLQRLAARFDELARPRHGRYVEVPARGDEGGTVSVPPRRTTPVPVLVGVGAALALGIALGTRARRRD
jgi:glyoxylase-like metal-dependent hydrolase (beta-lactamase superfamily II)